MRITIKYLPLLVPFVLCFFGTAQAQGPNAPAANMGFYRSYHAGGIFLHTQGLGANYRRGWRKTGFSNHVMDVEVLSLKDHKEYKIPTPSNQQLRSYHYGKINSVALVRGSYGGQRTLFDKEVKRGVRVSHLLLYGPTFALVKPVYVEFAARGSRRPEIVRYSTAIHSEGDVMGKAPALYKLGTTDIYPGLHIKYALNFEYSTDDAFIRALETGASLDFFYKRIAIMENGFNEWIFVTARIAFVFGRKEL